jgi:hypothetical protein
MFRVVSRLSVLVAIIVTACTAIPEQRLRTTPLGDGLVRIEPQAPNANALVEGASTAAQQAIAQARAELEEARKFDLRGTVEYPKGRLVAASGNDVSAGAAVMIYDGGSNAAVAATKTDPAGAFTLTLPGFQPEVNKPYLVEAVKGLGSQAPGKDAARLRTYALFDGTGWKSISNKTVGGPVLLSPLTSAVALISGLDPLGLPAASTIGKVKTTTNPPSLDNTVVIPLHPDQEISDVGTDLAAYLTGDFDPVASLPAIKPVISQLSPASSQTGLPLSIRGTGFSPIAGGNTVTIGGKPANVLSASPTLLIVEVPSVSGNSSVTVGTTRGTSNTQTLTAAAVTTAPIVSGFSPASAALGATLTIWGSNFTNDAKVNFSGAANTSPAVVDANSILVVIPAGAGAGNATVSNANGTSNRFYLAIAPAITGINPKSGNAGTVVTITGAAFGSSGVVQMGGVDVAPSSYANGSITVAVPASADDGRLSVTTAFGTATSADIFKLIPKITSISPDRGGPGTDVTLVGSGFGAGQGAAKILFGSVEATTFKAWGKNQIIVSVPPAVGSSIKVKVKGVNGDSNEVDFISYSPPRSHWIWDNQGRMTVVENSMSQTMYKESGAGNLNFGFFSNVNGNYQGGRICYDSKGNLFRSSTGRSNTSEIRRIDPNGNHTSIPLPGWYPYGMAIDSNDDIYVGFWSNNVVYKISGQSLQPQQLFGTSWPNIPAVAVDMDGNVYVSYRATSSWISKWTRATGQYNNTWANIPSGYPIGMAFGPDDKLYVNTRQRYIYQLDRSSGAVSQWYDMAQVACGDSGSSSIALDESGNVYISTSGQPGCSRGLYRIDKNRQASRLQSGPWYTF